MSLLLSSVRRHHSHNRRRQEPPARRDRRPNVLRALTQRRTNIERQPSRPRPSPATKPAAARLRENRRRRRRRTTARQRATRGTCERPVVRTPCPRRTLHDPLRVESPREARRIWRFRRRQSHATETAAPSWRLASLDSRENPTKRRVDPAPAADKQQESLSSEVQRTWRSRRPRLTLTAISKVLRRFPTS